VRVSAAILLSAGALTAIASIRLVLDGKEHLHEGEKLARDGERSRALQELEEAARAYVPGSPYPRRAIERMGIIAKGHEMRGDTASAMFAWEAIRRSVLSTRHVIQPSGDLLERSEHEIRRLQHAKDKGRDGAGPDPTARPEDPSPTASFLLFAGLLAWVGGSLALLVRPGPAGQTRSFSPGRLVSWAACLGGLILWLAMSYFAG
jgi:hypothetical protein